MKIYIAVESNKEDDGVETSVTYTYNNMEDLNDLAWAFSEAARAIGFTYVEQVGIKTEGGKEVWSEF